MPDPLVRIKTAIGTGAGPITVTFDEGTPLDSSYLLVATIAVQSVITAPSGWVESGYGGINGTSRRHYIYAKQGNGSLNSVTFSQASGFDYAVALMAFPGFVSTTPVVGNSGTFSISNFANLTIPSEPEVYGVAVAGMYAGSATSAFDNGYSNNIAAVSVGPSARKEYTGSAGSYNTGASLSTDTGRWALVVYELAVAAGVSYALGTTPVTLALGSTPVEAWKGAGAP